MPSSKEVTEEKQVAVTPSGKQVVKEKTAISVAIAPSDTVSQIVYFIVGVVELLLAARLVLKLLGANPSNSFVTFIYSISGPFELPFRGIFPATITRGIVTASILEPSSIAAMLVYLIIAVGVVELVKIMSRQPEE
jgi:uncharacterized protein YggT (Ycf19 family)